MYAVIKTGGKQYRVAAGEKIKVEQIAADVGQEIVIDQVLAVGNGADIKIGTPLVSGATVTVTVLAVENVGKVMVRVPSPPDWVLNVTAVLARKPVLEALLGEIPWKPPFEYAG